MIVQLIQWTFCVHDTALVSRRSVAHGQGQLEPQTESVYISCRRVETDEDVAVANIEISRILDALLSIAVIINDAKPQRELI